MVKTLAASSLILAAAADKVSLSYTDCGSASTHAKITDLSPATIDVPGKATVVGSGALDSDQTGAHFTLKVKKGILPLVSGKGNICEDTTINLPLGAGSFTVKGLDCPAKQGDVAVEVDLDILSSDFFKSEDGENSLVSIHIEANADDTGDQVICLDIEANQASYDKEWAEFQAVNGQRNGAIPEAFKRNVDFVKAENAKGNTYQLSHSGPFAAMTTEEYKQQLGYKPRALYGDLPKVGTHELTGKATADSIDWSTKGAVTAVKNQGQCGSCWAFSSTGGLEGQWEIASGKLQSLSEQQLVDCSKQNSGCNGGLMDYAFKFYESTSVATETSYAYTGRDGTCKSSYTTAIPQGGVTGYKDMSSESALLDAVSNVGPVSVAIEADQMSFQLYSSGVLTGNCGTNLDHGVLAVGYGTDSGTDYWKVKNSWGASWGMDGYVLIERGVNKCGIADGPPSYPTVSASVSV
jgi:cathepsin L